MTAYKAEFIVEFPVLLRVLLPLKVLLNTDTFTSSDGGNFISPVPKLTAGNPIYFAFMSIGLLGAGAIPNLGY